MLVDFWASWCGPCKMFSPIVDEFAEENQGKVKVGKINIDEEPDLAAQFRVMSIPTAMLFENGQVKETYTDSMLGNVVLVEHGPYQFYYCGVGENFLVNPGGVATMGQQLGVVTAVPFEAAEEPHLHLEVRRDGVALDPQAVLEGTV